MCHVCVEKEGLVLRGVCEILLTLRRTCQCFQNSVSDFFSISLELALKCHVIVKRALLNQAIDYI